MQQVNEAAALRDFIDLLIHLFTSRLSFLCLYYIVFNPQWEFPLPLQTALGGKAGLYFT